MKEKQVKNEDNIYVLVDTTYNDISIDNNTRQKCQINLDSSEKMPHQK